MLKVKSIVNMTIPIKIITQPKVEIIKEKEAKTLTMDVSLKIFKNIFGFLFKVMGFPQV